MKIVVVCGYCGKRHEVAAENAGRRGKCAQCGTVMLVPDAPAERALNVDGEDVPDTGYGLIEPEPASRPIPTKVVRPRATEPAPFAESSFHRATNDGASAPKRTRAKPDDAEDDPAYAILKRMPILLGVLIVAAVVVAVALPNGVKLAGSGLSLVGLALSVAAFAVAGFAAFKEDVLYGFLYLLIPLYTAYYIVSRIDDLRNWMILGGIGLGLSVVGGAMLAGG